MVGSQLPSHMCVQTQYDARSIRRAACQTDRPSGVRRERDGRSVYSVHVYRRFLEALLHGAIHGYKISICILFKSRGRGFSYPVGGGTVPPSRFDRDARRRGSRVLQM